MTASLGDALAKAFGDGKEPKKKKKKSDSETPLKTLSKKWGIADEDYDDFSVAFREAVKDCNSEN